MHPLKQTTCTPQLFGACHWKDGNTYGVSGIPTGRSASPVLCVCIRVCIGTMLCSPWEDEVSKAVSQSGTK